MPQIEMLYARDLRSITGGRANFHVEAGHYEEVPPNLVEKVLAANERRKKAVASQHGGCAASAISQGRAGRCSRHVDPDQGVARDKLRKLFLTQVLCVGRAHGEDHVADVCGAVVDNDLDSIRGLEAELAHHGARSLTARERYAKLLYQSGGGRGWPAGSRSTGCRRSGCAALAYSRRR